MSKFKEEVRWHTFYMTFGHLVVCGITIPYCKRRFLVPVYVVALVLRAPT